MLDKKQETIVLSITSPNVQWFSKFTADYDSENILKTG